MTVAELLKQAQNLSLPERRELAKLLIDTLAPTNGDDVHTEWKTGAEIVALINELGAVEFVDNDIDDPVTWVATQRQKRNQQLQEFNDE